LPCLNYTYGKEGNYMSSIEQIKQVIKSNKEALLKEYKVIFIGIFGSYAKGKMNQSSDIDVLVEFSEAPDIFTFIKLEEHLSGLLGVKVDMVTKKALKPAIRENILKEVIAA
jgi:uncharacterized protein